MAPLAAKDPTMPRIPAIVRPGVLALSLLLAVASTAMAQLGPQTQVSLESRLARADRVVRGTISNVERLPGEGDLFWERVTLDVSETIKGEAAAELTFFHQTRDRFAHHQDIMDAGLDYLWFLVTPRRYELGWHGPITDDIPEDALFLPANGHTIALDHPIELDRGTKPPYPVATMDLTTPRTPEEILTCARDAAAHEREHGEPTAHHGIDIAGLDPARVAPISGDGNFVLVPVDARLERLAHRLVASPEAFAALLASSADDQAQRRHAWATTALRRQGLTILALHFPTEANAALFVPMLESEHAVIRRGAELGEPARITYPMRSLAYTALSGMGHDVPEPELEAPINDASLAPSPAAVGQVHGPQGDWYDISEFFLELNGDSNPELLRLYVMKDTIDDTAYDLERLREEGASCWAFTLFSFHEGEPVMVFHRGNNLEGFSLSLREHDGRPMLFTKQPKEWTTRSAYGWWDVWGPGEGGHWNARQGDWDGEAHTFEPTGYAPLVRFDQSK